MATRRKKASRDEDDEPVRRKKTTRSGSSTRSRSRRSAGASKRGPIEIDFAKAGEGGAKRYREGDYHVKFVSHDFGRSKDKDTPYVQVGLEFMDGKYKGEVWEGMGTRLYLSDSSLWRIRSFLEAMEVRVPRKKVNIDFSKYYNKELGITVVDGEPYNGRVKSEIADFLDLDTLRGADEEDEDYDDEDEEEEDEEEEDEDDEDEDEEDEEEMEEMDVDDDL